MLNINNRQKNYFQYIFLILFISLLKETLSENNKNEIVINEISTNNKNILRDSYGNYSSWIELFNKGKNSLDISGYGLSNENYIPLKWTFPKNTFVKSGEYLLVFISDEKSIDGEFHTNFKLDKDGDILFFSNSKGEILENI